MRRRPFLIRAGAPPAAFPRPEQALREPNGLLAVGGDLRPERLLAAYRRGIFPWFSEGQPVLWWSPDPRAVFFPERFHCSRSLRRTLRRASFVLRVDRDFRQVMLGCAGPRETQDGTWITPDMIDAYDRLHTLGYAHSVEAWQGDHLVGGVYGVAIGRVFFGESMFSRTTDASKATLYALCGMGFGMIDCQIANPHLARLGALEVPRADFLALLGRWIDAPAVPMALARHGRDRS